jgi:hypothetical protein
VTNGAQTQTQAKHKTAKAQWYSDQAPKQRQAAKDSGCQEGKEDSGQQIASDEKEQKPEDEAARNVRAQCAKLEKDRKEAA